MNATSSHKLALYGAMVLFLTLTSMDGATASGGGRSMRALLQGGWDFRLGHREGPRPPKPPPPHKTRPGPPPPHKTRPAREDELNNASEPVIAEEIEAESPSNVMTPGFIVFLTQMFNWP